MKNQSSRLINAARELLKAHGYFVDNLWHISDINFLCEQANLPALSHEEAMEVFAIANAQFDGESGICWPQLERALRTFQQNSGMVVTSLEEERKELHAC